MNKTIAIGVAAGLAVLAGCASRDADVACPVDIMDSYIDVTPECVEVGDPSRNLYFRKCEGKVAEIYYVNENGENVRIDADSWPATYEYVPSMHGVDINGTYMRFSQNEGSEFPTAFFPDGTHYGPNNEEEQQVIIQFRDLWMQHCEELRCLEAAHIWLNLYDYSRGQNSLDVGEHL